MRDPIPPDARPDQEKIQPFAGLDPTQPWGDPGENDFRPEEIERFSEASCYFFGLLPLPAPSALAPISARFVKACSKFVFGSLGRLGLYALIIGLVFSSPLILALLGDEIAKLLDHIVGEFREAGRGLVGRS